MSDSPSFDIPEAIRITAGAIGEPGMREFFVQCEGDGQLVTIGAEKQQVSALAQAILEIVDQLEPGDEGEAPEDGQLDLVEPVFAAWRTGDIALEYDEAIDRIAITMTEAVLPDDEPAATARFVATRAQARALADHAITVVEAGRPRCQLCGNPIEIDGTHMCPTMNGHRHIED